MYEDAPYEQLRMSENYPAALACWERDRVIQDAKQLYATLRSVIGANQMEAHFPRKNYPWLDPWVNVDNA